MIAPSTAGRVAIVTGSNKGIGFYVALQLASSGLFQTLILACRDPVRGQTAAEQIIQALPSNVNTTVSYEPLTLGDTASHASFCQKMGQTFGGKEFSRGLKHKKICVR